MSRHFIATLTKFVAALLLIGIALPPQSSAKGFQTGPPLYTVGLNPFYVVSADLRGVGKQDLIVSNSDLNGGGGTSTTISVLLSNGDGTYQPAVNYNVGNNPIGIAVGKFTSSGHLDLAVANPKDNTISILLGNGDGTFQPQTTINVGVNPVGVFAADLNKDGKLDLVVTNSDLFGTDSCASSSVSILLGNGNGTFQSPTTVQAGLCPLGAVIASLRNNGTLDLVVVNNGGMNSTTTSNVSVLLGNGDGTFQPAVNYGVGSRPDIVGVADFDKDGTLDLAVSDQGGKNTGTNGGISLLLGNGNGTFQTATFISNVTKASGIVTGDFNNDGNQDVASYNNTNSVFVLLGNGNGTFQAPKNFALANGQFGIAAADFNGDGKLDLAVPLDLAPNPSAVAVLLGNGDGTFQGGITTYFFNSSPQSIVSANLNNDGKPDLVVGLTNFNNCNPTCTEASSVEPLTGNGDGTFNLLPTINLFNNAGATGVATGSFQNNGKQDIVVSQNGSLGNGFLSYIAGNGDGTFQAPANTTFNTMNPFQITAADFNNDGNLDFVLGNCGALAVFFGNGAGSFTLNNQYNNGFNCDSGQVAVGDVNGDGLPDMVVTDSDNASNFNAYVFLNNGSGGFTGPATYHLGPSPGSISGAGLVLGHFKESTSAGHLDIAATDPVNNTVNILINNGDGTFTFAHAYTVGTNPVYIAKGQFDGTGHAGLAVANCTNCNASNGVGSTINVLYGNGDGTFTADPNNYVAGAGSVAIAANDFNGDGAPDLAVANSNGNTVAILLNTGGTRINLTSSLNPANFGQSVTFTATVTASVTTGTPTGTVTFMDGATTLGTGNLSGNQATFMTSTLSGGTHTITAVYGGDSFFNPHTSSPITQVVNGGVSTTTSVGSSLNPSVYGQAVTFTATVTPSAGGPPTGTVTFKDGASVLGTGTLNTANPPQAIFTATAPPLTGGSHSITAVYGGDSNFGGSTSPAITQTVNQATTTVAVASSLNPSAFGQSVTFTATITPSGAGTPSGTVTFKDGTTTLGTGTLNNASPPQATFTISTLAVGGHSMTTVYGGDTNFNGSTSSVLTQTVTQATTTTAVTSSLNPSVSGQSVAFTATVTPLAGGTPTGTVTFKDGTTTLGTGTLNNATPPQATFTTSALTLGSHSITAVYGGDTNFTTSTSPALTQNVLQATTTAVTSTQNPSVVGQSVTFTATVTPSGAGTPTGTVTFKDGTTILGTGTLNGSSPPQATFTTSALAAGSHSITAVYGGDANFGTSTSSVLTQTVLQVTTTAVTSSLNPSVFGQTVTFTATVTPAAGGPPTGTVTFKDGTTTLGTGALNASTPPQATFTISALTAGSHSITAVYGGDANFNGSTSPALTQTVTKAATTTAVSSSLNPSTFGQSVTFTATVTTASAGGPPTGTVTFMDGVTTLGTGTLNNATPDQATFTTAALAIGNHSITAVYAGDTNFAGSTSPAFTQVVDNTVRISTTTSLTASVTPAHAGQAANTVLFRQTVTFTASVTPATGPSGTVTFMDGVATLGTATLNGSGQAIFSTNNLRIGLHPIVANYSGDFNYLPSSSSTLNEYRAPRPK